MRTHDVAIIGGSLAGASCAVGLKSLGLDVVTFDRDSFPRRKVCGELLSPGAIRCLKLIGVHEEVTRAGAVQIESLRLKARSYRFDIPFPEPALGFSRERLDVLLASKAGVEHGCKVEGVRKVSDGFVLTVLNPAGDPFEVFSRIILDAAGRLSRFTRMVPSAQYGVQYHRAGEKSSILDFEFFEGGYGGVVSVEGRRRNFCFLVDREHVQRFRRGHECTVTGRIAYERAEGPYLSIGDSGGMVDPFCGEGMRNALESGLLSAEKVGEGLRKGHTYNVIRDQYDAAYTGRWRKKRAITAALRTALGSRSLSVGLFALGSSRPKLASLVLRKLWS